MSKWMLYFGWYLQSVNCCASTNTNVYSKTFVQMYVFYRATNWSSAPQLLCYSYCNDKGPLSKSTRIKSFIKKPFRSKFVIFFTVIDLRKKMNKKLQIHTKDCISHNTVF